MSRNVLWIEPSDLNANAIKYVFEKDERVDLFHFHSLSELSDFIISDLSPTWIIIDEKVWSQEMVEALFSGYQNVIYTGAESIREDILFLKKPYRVDSLVDNILEMTI